MGLWGGKGGGYILPWGELLTNDEQSSSLEANCSRPITMPTTCLAWTCGIHRLGGVGSHLIDSLPGSTYFGSASILYKINLEEDKLDLAPIMVGEENTSVEPPSS